MYIIFDYTIKYSAILPEITRDEVNRSVIANLNTLNNLIIICIIFDYKVFCYVTREKLNVKAGQPAFGFSIYFAVVLLLTYMLPVITRDEVNRSGIDNLNTINTLIIIFIIFEYEVFCYVTREKLNDRAGQPAYIYNIHFFWFFNIFCRSVIVNLNGSFSIF